MNAMNPMDKTQVTIKARLVDSAHGTVTLELDLTPVCLKIDMPPEVINPNTGQVRAMTEDESRDFEDLLDDFIDKSTARALTKLIVRGR